MDWMEAIQKMKTGHKVRRPTFHNGNYLYFDKHILMCGLTKERAYLCEGHFTADDWELVKEIPMDRLNMTDEERIGYISALDDIEELIRTARRNLKEDYEGKRK